MTLVHFLYPKKSFNHLEHTFLSLFVSFSKTPPKYCSSFLNLQTPKLFTSFIHSIYILLKHIPFLSSCNLFDIMAKKINVSVPFMFDDRTPIIRERSFYLENFTTLPEVHSVFEYQR